MKAHRPIVRQFTNSLGERIWWADCSCGVEGQVVYSTRKAALAAYKLRVVHFYR